MKLVNIGAEDLVDGNRTLILGLTWSLILKFEIQNFGADEAQLLRWVRARVDHYDGVTIATWADSFLDGLAFTALMHQCDAASIDYVAPTPEAPVNFQVQLESAFTVAESTCAASWTRVVGVADVTDVTDVTEM